MSKEVNVLGVTEYAGKHWECYGTRRSGKARVVCRQISAALPSKAAVAMYPEEIRNMHFLRWGGLAGARRRRFGY